jgi:cob(I)alamin adenosyltransferase
MSVVTKQGDLGRTKFFSGEEVPKSHPRLETYGTLDELISSLGLARSLCNDTAVAETIHALQRELFQLGAELATANVDKAPFTIEPINATHVAALDAIVKDIESRVTLPAAFIIPGGCQGSAALDVARTICRRLERRMITLRDTEEFQNRDAIQYINRLSDVCFLLGRAEEAAEGIAYDDVPTTRNRQ